jgi:phosphoribosylformylglycinamidine synthase
MRALILAGYGLNCEEETQHAFDRAGVEAKIMHINDLSDNPNSLNDVQILAVPGGFSYGDDTGSGNAFAQKMQLALWEPLQKFIARDTLTIGICNGCQILVNMGLIPVQDTSYGERALAVTHNLTARYGCRWVDVGANPQSSSPWLRGITRMHLPVAHGEGRFMMDEAVLQTLQQSGQIALRYVKKSPPSPPTPPHAGGKTAQQSGGEWVHAQGQFPDNPNGSMADIAGVTDPSGRILALMPHPERGMFTWQRDDYMEAKDRARRADAPLPEFTDGFQLFANAAAYFNS